MRKNIISTLILALLISACSKAITLGIINRSGQTITITQPVNTDCRSNQVVFFISERMKHDIEISMNMDSFSYDLLPMPSSYLDIRNNKRLLFVFDQDHRLYLLKPTDDPLSEKISEQPAGYPLIPAKN